MNKLLNKIPVALRVLILIVSSIALGISLFWAYTEKNQIEPKLSVVTSLLAILIFGADIYSQLNNNNSLQTPTTNTTTHTHSGKGDIVAGDKVKGDKVQGNKYSK
ncbi:MAG TPA: hypothetical protein PKA00_21640 [Saprospiraceae bacterium]|nr:hypothetical protein [Ignavibacteria bacterium]HMQ85529.1 hypothetical protein [Saprospiraceae bacterium]